MPCKPADTPRSRRVVQPCAAWKPMIAEIAAAHRIHPRDMMCGLKSNKAVAARHELWWRLYQRGFSLAEIGRRLGGFHHTTVMHGVAQWAAHEQKEAA